MWLTSLIPSKPRLFDCRPRFSCPPTTERPRLPPCLLLHCLELSMRKWCTELNSRIKNKEWAAAAAGFGVTGEVGRSSCELEFQRPTPAEVVGSAHTFHISQSSLGWDSQKEGELGCFFFTASHLLKAWNIAYVDTLKSFGAIGLLPSPQQSMFELVWGNKRETESKRSGNTDCGLKSSSTVGGDESWKHSQMSKWLKGDTGMENKRSKEWC